MVMLYSVTSVARRFLGGSGWGRGSVDTAQMDEGPSSSVRQPMWYSSAWAPANYDVATGMASFVTPIAKSTRPSGPASFAATFGADCVMTWPSATSAAS